ncbi:MAG: dimethylglycine dehydrogenase, partial [Gammaproteobacteria bacterium]
HAEVGNRVAVHVVGVERQATIIDDSPYDPTGSAMRG